MSASGMQQNSNTAFALDATQAEGAKNLSRGGRNMKHDFNLKERETADIPPEKLYEILRGIYPKENADKIFKNLTGLEPPKDGDA